VTGHIFYDPEGRKLHFVWEMYREVFNSLGMTGICPLGSACFFINTVKPDFLFDNVEMREAAEGRLLMDREDDEMRKMMQLRQKYIIKN